MYKYEYMICDSDLNCETDEFFIKNLNKLGEERWEVICKIPTLLSNFRQILLKRKIDYR